RFSDLQSLLRGRGSTGISQSWPGMAQSDARRLTPLLILWSAATAAIVGFAFYGEWDRLLRLVLGQDFGTTDPIFLRDVGFYLFVLPFLNLVQTSLVLLTLSVTLMLGLAYFGTGALQFGAKGFVAANPRVLRHLLANAFLLLTAWAWGYYLDRFGLLTKSAGVVFGAGGTGGHVVFAGLWVGVGGGRAPISVVVVGGGGKRPRH